MPGKRRKVSGARFVDGGDGDGGDEMGVVEKGKATMRVVGKSALHLLPPEIWTIIAQSLTGTKTLASLVLVCSAFRTIFSPMLHQTRRYRLGRVLPGRPRYVSLPPQVQAIRSLRVTAEDLDDFRRCRYHGNDVDDRSNYEQARFLTRLVKSIPGLESFTWYEDGSHGYSMVPIVGDENFLRALATRTKMKHLYIGLPNMYLEHGPDAYSLLFPLGMFSNLISLEIYNFWGFKERLVCTFASVIVRCPDLKTLGLGMASDSEGESDPEYIFLESRDFLRLLCERYKTINGRPLQLNTLKLGWQICVCEEQDISESVEVENYLDFLFCQETLRTLHVFNGHIEEGTHDAVMDENECLLFDWAKLDRCTSLHQLAITRLNRGVKNWLEEVAKDVTELVFCDTTAMDGVAQLYLPHLPHSLTTLFAMESGYNPTNEAYVEDYDIDMYSDAEPDTDSDLGEDDETPSPRAQRSFREDTFDASHVQVFNILDHMKPVDVDEDECLRSWKDPARRVVKQVEMVGDRVATVLDRLQDGGKNLEQLAVSLELPIQWDHFLENLKALKHLCVLRVKHRIWKYGKWPKQEDSLWRHAKKSRDIASRFSWLIKAACPSVQYLRFGDWCWQFIAQRDIKKIKKNDVRSHYEMIDMEWSEVLQFEVLAYDTSNSQTGLPQKDSHHPLSEEEWAKFDETYQRIIASARFDDETEDEFYEGLMAQ